MYYKAPPSKALPAPHKAATSFKYVSDGSGRDFYVTYNSGGLEAAYVPGQKHPVSAFFDSLRRNQRIVKYKRHISPKELDLMKRSRSTQKVLVERLTASSSKWKELTSDHRRSSSRRSRYHTNYLTHIATKVNLENSPKTPETYSQYIKRLQTQRLALNSSI